LWLFSQQSRCPGLGPNFEGASLSPCEYQSGKKQDDITTAVTFIYIASASAKRKRPTKKVQPKTRQTSFSSGA
jgi:hypothetical protein